jgi:hypothetical protein
VPIPTVSSLPAAVSVSVTMPQRQLACSMIAAIVGQPWCSRAGSASEVLSTSRSARALRPSLIIPRAALPYRPLQPCA